MLFVVMFVIEIVVVGELIIRWGGKLSVEVGFYECVVLVEV